MTRIEIWHDNGDHEVFSTGDKEESFTEAELKRAHKDLVSYDSTTVERMVKQARKNRAYDKERQ